MTTSETLTIYVLIWWTARSTFSTNGVVYDKYGFIISKI